MVSKDASAGVLLQRVFFDLHMMMQRIGQLDLARKVQRFFGVRHLCVERP